MKTIFFILLTANIIYLLGTLYFSTKPIVPPPVQTNPGKITLVSPFENCLIWGNFYEEQIRYAEKVLTESHPNLTFNVEKAGDTTMYWLYIPPYPNKDTANREINKLRNIGVVSFRVKDDAQWENAISLGIFHDQKDAMKQLNEIEQKGVSQAKIENRPVVLQKIVIHLSSEFSKEELKTLTEQFDGTKLVQDKCERL